MTGRMINDLWATIFTSAYFRVSQLHRLFLQVFSKKVKKKMIKINTRRGGGSLEYWIKVLAFCLLLFTFCIFETPGSVKSTLSSSSYNAVLNTFKYWRSYWHIWYTVPEHLQAGRSLVFSLNQVLNAHWRTSPSASQSPLGTSNFQVCPIHIIPQGSRSSTSCHTHSSYLACEHPPQPPPAPLSGTGSLLQFCLLSPGNSLLLVQRKQPKHGPF